MLSEQPSNIVEKSAEEEPKRKTRKNLPKHVTENLKSWLVEHRHHPYPEDTDKSEFARQHNLTVTQINNWFINNRRRFFKKEYPANAKANVFKRKKAVGRLVRKKEDDSENETHSSLSSPGTSVSHEECQSSDVSQSSLQDSAASSCSSPSADRCQVIHESLQKEYPFKNQLSFLASITIIDAKYHELY